MKTSELLRKVSSEKQTRSFAVDRAAINEETRTVALAFSSEEEYERWFGIEVLDHAEGSVRMGRMEDGAAVLVNHNADDQVGVVEEASIDTDRRGRAVVRFGESARAQEIFRDIQTGIRKHVSVGYMVHRMEEDADRRGVFYVKDWEPIEVSIVPIPADATVGVGRSAEDNAPQEAGETITEDKSMKEDPKTIPDVNVEEIESAAQKAERNRVRDILALGKDKGFAELAAEYASEGRSLSDFRQAVLDRMGPANETKDDPEIGMTDKEVGQFRLMRLIDAMANPRDRGKQDAAAFEFEACAAAAAKRHKTPEGMAVPADIVTRGQATPQQRDIVAGAGGTGQYLVGTDTMPMVEALQNALMVRRLGATVFTGLDGDVSFPRENGQASVYWVGEGSDVTESTPGFQQISMTPKTAGAFTDLTRKFILQSSIDAENWLRGHLALKIAIAADLAAINGAGTPNEPMGILNTSGIGGVAMGANGGTVTYAKIVALENEISTDNALVNNMAFLTNSVVRNTMRQTPEHATLSTGDWIYNSSGPDQGEVLGYPCYISNNVPSTLLKSGSSNTGSHSALIFGNWADLYLGFWSGIDINVDSSTLSKSGGVRVVALQDMDVALAHPESFAAIKDAIASS